MSMFRALSVQVVLALIAGLAVGAWIELQDRHWLSEAARWAQAAGALWLNALRMTVVPLVFALLVKGVASFADAASTGRLATRAVLLFTLLIFAAAIYAVAASYGLMALWPVDQAAGAAFIAGARTQGAEPVPPPDFVQWIQSLAPANVISAAAQDQVLPLVVFAVFFGFAATRLAPSLRDPLVTFFDAVGEAMIVIVRWVLLAAPVGVFALSLGVGANAGLGAAGVLLHYIIFVSLVTIGITLACYPLATLWARLSFAKYAANAAPAQVVAFSTQSSLASLPAMLESSAAMGVPERVRDLVLPLAVAVFRFTSPVANLAVCFFIAKLYGIESGPLHIVSAIFVAFAVSVASVGLPGQVSFFASVAPICIALGLPTDLLPILLAVEVVPDIFRTIGNVSGDLVAAAILRRDGGKDAMPADA
ncbi:MAG: cation:dicarboxylase symporter family transporter [Hyphomonadaceae bacterium]|nr:cation:dicarboxylase symporter family transporter [Hyphomonadaceae bacterium]